MRRAIAICCLASGLLIATQNTGAACKSLSYEDRNQTDYGPLQVAKVRGVARDAEGVTIPRACVGLFSELGHKLVATTQTNDRGEFELAGIPDGSYRLVAKYEGFSSANARIRIEKHSQSKKSLTVQMRLLGIDARSFVELR
jgi:Carboxypeptidase regulatory-like domain